RPWIDWIHTSRDQGAYIRSIIKWDDQPTSPDALVESMMRANMLTRSAPTAPVYICLDAGFQEQKLDKEPEWPDVTRFKPPAPPRPSKEPVDEALALLQGARGLGGDRSQAGRGVSDRSSGALLSAVQRARQGRARIVVRSRCHRRARL